MTRLTFTANLRRHVDCADIEVPGGTLRQVLDAAFESNARMRGYVLDDQDAIRKHVMIFIDNQPVRDLKQLTDVVSADGEVFIMQALSGG